MARRQRRHNDGWKPVNKYNAYSFNNVIAKKDKDGSITSHFDGDPVWIGQISRDIGVRFTFKTWPPVTHKIDPDIDEAMYALLEDLIYSQQVGKAGWVKGVGAATRSKPRKNLTGDPYFTAGYRSVILFGDRPYSFAEIESFGWESPLSMRLKRMETDLQQDFDEHR